MRVQHVLCVLCSLGSQVFAADAPAPGGSVVVADYPFDGDARDISGSGRDGTLHGKPAFAPGKTGSSIVLDGEHDFVDCGLWPVDLAREFTIECWVKPEAKQNPCADLFGNHYHGALGIALEQAGGNTNQFAAHYGAGEGRWVSTPPVRLVAERWQHVAVVKSAAELRLYVNGILLGAARDSAPMAASPQPFRIGQSLGMDTRCFRGQVGRFRVHRQALSEFREEIAAEDRLETIVGNFGLTVRPGVASRVFDREHPPEVELGYAGPEVPQAVELITASLQCVDLTGRVESLAPVSLSAKDGFKAKVQLALGEGYYRLTVTPTLLAGGVRRALPPSSCSFAVRVGREEVLAASAAATPAPDRGPTSPGAATSAPTRVLSLDGDGWQLAVDPQNVGRQDGWASAARPAAKPTKVPWIIQDVFPDYHGVAWYWREFAAPANPHAEGRTILRFAAVDYLAEVWLNGTPVGGHEGAEDPFELDVTAALRPGAANLLAVRVVSPTHEPIDGIALAATPRSCRTYPVTPGTTYSVGGIVDSVELLSAPAVRIENLYVKPDWRSGRVEIEANLRNAAPGPLRTTLRLTIGPASGGETLDGLTFDRELRSGDTLVRGHVQVAQPRLWNLEDPFLYRVTAQAALTNSPSCDERSTRCGFRDFRYQNDAFRLNGRRLYLQGALILPHYPVGFRLSPRVDTLRRDLQAYKAMGLNTCRIIWGGLRARDLDLFDEMGILVQQEHYGAIQMADTPEMPGRFDASLAGVLRRDRNHPSIVIWCLLNEISAGPQFQHAVESLPLVKYLDDTRVVWLNSGGFDMQLAQGSVSNPGSTGWEYLLGNERPDGPVTSHAMSGGQAEIKADIHPYQPVPHTAVEIERMRTLGARANGRKIMITEIGTGCAVNLPRFARHYEQMGAESADDARYYRDKLEQFLADWQTWDLGRIWPRPEDYFSDSERNMVRLRRETGNALRANPYLAGSYFCALPDSDFNGIGLLNSFREYKPGVVDLQADLTAPLRWCLFAEPAAVYRGGTLKLEAVLSNLDALRPGTYPVRVAVLAPDGGRVFEEAISVDVADPQAAGEAPLVRGVFARELPISGVAGEYAFVVQFERGAAASGEEIHFRVFDPAEMPPVAPAVTLWGRDEGLSQWLAEHGIATRPYAVAAADRREVILVGNGGGDVAAFRDLAQRLARGATAIFLSPAVFTLGDRPTALVPCVNKGTLGALDFCGGYYRGDTFAPRHPVFAGLPAGGVLDYSVYRNLIPQGGWAWCGLEAPAELLCGGIRAQFGYQSGLLLATYRLGAGRFTLNTLRIRENLGSDPVAERLLRNLLNHAGSELGKPLMDMPSADLDKLLETIGYQP
jgi:hypothetical protein